ncbi:RNA polymerase sigma factor [Allosphingosinicella sp.]|uniref:RNA polymerase sigma factor n=1 Tax=Allosphingosinicella sp. TaxID=2823234 RepID=UPI002FC155B1
MALEKARILDEYLVASAKAGDRAAFALLARRWHRKLVAHAWRLTGDGEAARDAAQTGWGEIAAGLHRLRDERAFPAWAYRIVSRACAGQIGRAKRRRELADAVTGEPPVAQPDAGAGLDADRLRAAVRALPPDQRSAVALFHFEDMSVAEVAVALHVPAGTVKTRLMHARRKLRAALEGEE